MLSVLRKRLQPAERHRWFGLCLQPPMGDFLEEIIYALYANLLRPGDLAVDCGANIGAHTTRMSEAVGPAGCVIAVEAIPALARSLKDRAIGNVEVIDKASGLTPGRLDFHIVGDNSGYSGLRARDDLPAELAEQVSSINVPVTTLDDILRDQPRPVRLIKLDLEGGEYHAIQGGRSVIARDRPFIVFETGRGSSAQLYSYSREDFFSLFDSLGLRLFDLFGSPFGPESWEAADVPWNFVAVRPGTSDERFVLQRLPRLIRKIAASRASRL